jgi:hypothetical protein
MAPKKRISPPILQADLDTLAAAHAITNYAPANITYDKEGIEVKRAALAAAQEAERVAQAASDAARDNANAAEWDFHDFTLAVKEQVIAQFGMNSNEVQSLGLKKKSEYKAPTRNTPPAE